MTKLILHPPNTFIQFWKARELREWLAEVIHREKIPHIYKSSFPSSKQVKKELKRRKLKL